MRWRIVRLEVVSSTMDIARELAEAGRPEGTVVVARRQTRGRGRLGRGWASPEGGLWFSVLLRPRLAPADLSKLPIVASLAVARALRRLYGLPAELEWPNDVLVRGRKVCGVLVESAFSGREVLFSVVGIGVNANFGLEALPGGLRERATTLRELLGHDVDLEELLNAILSELGACYLALREGRGSELLREAERLLGFPRPLLVACGGRVFSGTALGLAEDGSLLLRLPDGAVRAFSWAEATIKKP